jgi:hypothetical protein
MNYLNRVNISMEYKNKYAYTGTKKKPNGQPGRHENPDLWVTGPDPIRRDKYYAWMKHKAQAKFRNETYELAFEDWERFWTDEHWFNRGRHVENVILTRKDFELGWHLDNIEIISRSEYHKRRKLVQQ